MQIYDAYFWHNITIVFYAGNCLALQIQRRTVLVVRQSMHSLFLTIHAAPMTFPVTDMTRFSLIASSFYSSDVCDGVCRDKTGLYADPFSRRHYVACGYEVINGRPCPCCRPYYLPCPHRTEWNDKLKKCTWIAPPSIMGKGYKYGFR